MPVDFWHSCFDFSVRAPVVQTGSSEDRTTANRALISMIRAPLLNNNLAKSPLHALSTSTASLVPQKESPSYSPTPTQPLQTTTGRHPVLSCLLSPHLAPPFNAPPRAVLCGYCVHCHSCIGLPVLPLTMPGESDVDVMLRRPVRRCRAAEGSPAVAAGHGAGER